MPVAFEDARRLIAALVCLVLAAWMLSTARAQDRVRAADDRLFAGEALAAVEVASRVGSRPAEARAQLVRARAAVAAGELDLAAEAFGRAEELTPNDWTLHRDRAIVELARGRRGEARRQLARALGLNPRMALPPALLAGL